MKETLKQKIGSSIILLPLILPLGIMPNNSNNEPKLVEGCYVSRYGGITKITSDSFWPTYMVDYDNDGKVDEKYTEFNCFFRSRIEYPITQKDHEFFNEILSKAEENNKFP